MFKKQPEQVEGVMLVSPEEIDTYQRSSDPKTEAPLFIDKTRQELRLKEIHSWHASNTIQIQLAMAHIAMFNDRTAEILTREGLVKTKHGDRLPGDVAAFALGLSQHAIRQFDEGRQVAPPYGVKDVEFSDEWRERLNPEVQLPYWPAYWLGGENPSPEWQGTEVSGLSTAFLKGIICAAREIQTYVDADFRQLTHQQALVPIPDEYSEAEIPQYIQRRLKHADIDLTTVERFTANASALPDEIKRDNYGRAHDVFVEMVQLELLVVTPQLLGPDFAPAR